MSPSALDKALSQKESIYGGIPNSNHAVWVVNSLPLQKQTLLVHQLGWAAVSTLLAVPHHAGVEEGDI